MMVMVVAWGSAGLLVSTYWQIPLSHNAYHGDRDIFQLHRSHKSKGSSYADSQGQDIDIGQKGDTIHGYSQHTNGSELEDEYQVYYELHKEASDLSYKPKHKSSLGHPTSALHQSSLRYDNGLKSREISLGHPTNEDFMRKGVKSASIPESHQSHKNNHYYKKGDTSARSPLSGNMTSLREKEIQGENSLIMTSERDGNEMKINGSSQPNQGAPRLILLLTRWRSGSTFLGELLSTAVSETFYR